jgi:hypothetical protein
MANTRGNRLSLEARLAALARPERRPGTWGGQLSQPLSGVPRFWLTANVVAGPRLRFHSSLLLHCLAKPLPNLEVSDKSARRCWTAVAVASQQKCYFKLLVVNSEMESDPD